MSITIFELQAAKDELHKLINSFKPIDDDFTPESKVYALALGRNLLDIERLFSFLITAEKLIPENLSTDEKHQYYSLLTGSVLALTNLYTRSFDLIGKMKKLELTTDKPNKQVKATKNDLYAGFLGLNSFT